VAAYTIYGSHQSLFTRKFEAALQFYGAPFELRRKRGSGREREIESRSGTHQIPVMHTPENWMIADTTPMMMVMDGRYPARAMFPAGVAGVLSHLVEEFFDEWVARVMVHYRWNYPASAAVASRQIADGDEAVAGQIREWGPRACRATGVGTPELGEAAEQEYRQILTRAEHQLEHTRFLLGDRPTALDCAVLGGLRAHILNDPDPRAMMYAFPRVTQWCEGAGQWDGQGVAAAEPTPFAEHVLVEMARSYQPFVLANARALSRSQKTFTVVTHGIEASYLARSYPERSRQMVRHRIAHVIDAKARAEVAALLERFRLEAFL